MRISVQTPRETLVKYTEIVPVRHTQQKSEHPETGLGVRLQTNSQVEDLNIHKSWVLSLSNREHSPQNHFIHYSIPTYIF